MGMYKIVFVCENGFRGTEIVPAVNRTMALEIFEEIMEEYDTAVVKAECYFMN